MSEDKAYDMWKELEAAKAEIDRLRAENAELRDAAQSLVSEIRITGTHGSWKYLAEILAKTAKEGE